MKVYYGDLHNHCGISYGYGSLSSALKNAKVHMDFCCITGHAMWPDMYPRNADTAFVVDFHERGFAKLKEHWPEVRETVNAANCADFVTLQSYEMHSTHYGDHHLVSPDGDLPLIYRNSPAELVRDCGCRAIAVPHHIGYTAGYRGIDWDEFDRSISPIIEVVSKHGCTIREDNPFGYYHNMGPMDPHHTVAAGLRMGKRFSLVGSTDHHAGFPGSYGDGIAAVWAKGKTREDIFDALQKGHTYALTGDRMNCEFTLNDAMMGDTVTDEKRALRLFVRGDAPIEMLTLRRNGHVIAGKVCDPLIAEYKDKKFILRVEMGWGNSPENYHWDGSINVSGGRFTRVQPYLRGKNALSPNDKLSGEDTINDLNDGYAMTDEHVDFWCDTFRNVSPQHPMTSAFVFEVEGTPDSFVTLTLGGMTRSARIRDLTEYGFSGEVKPWHSHAWKMHTAYPESLCQAELLFDDIPETATDYYQAEAVQINGHRAFCSPIFADR